MKTIPANFFTDLGWRLRRFIDEWPYHRRCLGQVYPERRFDRSGGVLSREHEEEILYEPGISNLPRRGRNEVHVVVIIVVVSSSSFVISRDFLTQNYVKVVSAVLLQICPDASRCERGDSHSTRSLAGIFSSRSLPLSHLSFAYQNAVNIRPGGGGEKQGSESSAPDLYEKAHTVETPG